MDTGQMAEKNGFEVRPKKGKKLQNVPFLKSIFYHLAHMKFKSKISYLGEKIRLASHLGKWLSVSNWQLKLM